jgi:hypothetical protein
MVFLKHSIHKQTQAQLYRIAYAAASATAGCDVCTQKIMGQLCEFQVNHRVWGTDDLVSITKGTSESTKSSIIIDTTKLLIGG